jgi:hypothetical protein
MQFGAGHREARKCALNAATRRMVFARSRDQQPADHLLILSTSRDGRNEPDPWTARRRYT